MNVSEEWTVEKWIRYFRAAFVLEESENAPCSSIL